MKLIPLVRVAALLPCLTFLKEIGAPVQKLLAAVRLPAVACHHPEALIPLHQGIHLFARAARSQGIEHFGAQVGQRARFEALGTFGRLTCGSFTLHEAIGTASRLIGGHSSGERLWLTVRGEQAALCHQFVVDIDRGYQAADEYALMYLLHLVRLAASSAWRPQEVQLQSGPSVGLDKVDLLTESRLVFNHEFTAVLLPRALLSLPLTRRAQQPAMPLDMETNLWLSAPAGDFSGSLRQVLEALLQEGYPAIELAADAVGMSVRTLQRRLAGAELSYGRLVERVRFEKAVRLLAQPDVRLLDVAFELGYSEAANFSRAFRRWTGVAPSEFRRQRLLM